MASSSGLAGPAEGLLKYPYLGVLEWHIEYGKTVCLHCMVTIGSNKNSIRRHFLMQHQVPTPCGPTGISHQLKEWNDRFKDVPIKKITKNLILTQPIPGLRIESAFMCGMCPKTALSSKTIKNHCSITKHDPRTMKQVNASIYSLRRPPIPIIRTSKIETHIGNDKLTVSPHVFPHSTGVSDDESSSPSFPTGSNYRDESSSKRQCTSSAFSSDADYFNLGDEFDNYSLYDNFDEEDFEQPTDGPVSPCFTDASIPSDHEEKWDTQTIQNILYSLELSNKRPFDSLVSGETAANSINSKLEEGLYATFNLSPTQNSVDDFCFES